jgi:hypothetical protein
MTTTAEPAVAKAESKGQATEYVILEQRDEIVGTAENTKGTFWREASRKTASSADAAIKAHAAEKEGVFVAIPARSWTPRTVKVETRKVVRLA